MLHGKIKLIAKKYNYLSRKKNILISSSLIKKTLGYWKVKYSKQKNNEYTKHINEKPYELCMNILENMTVNNYIALQKIDMIKHMKGNFVSQYSEWNRNEYQNEIKYTVFIH